MCTSTDKGLICMPFKPTEIFKTNRPDACLQGDGLAINGDGQADRNRSQNVINIMACNEGRDDLQRANWRLHDDLRLPQAEAHLVRKHVRGLVVHGKRHHRNMRRI